MDRTYLLVPFAEKNEAKKLGARWDPDKRLWYVPERMDPAPFQRWMPSEQDGEVPPSASLIRYLRPNRPSPASRGDKI